MSHTHIKVYTLSDMNVSYHTEVIEHVALGHKVIEIIHIKYKGVNDIMQMILYEL